MSQRGSRSKDTDKQNYRDVHVLPAKPESFAGRRQADWIKNSVPIIHKNEKTACWTDTSFGS